MLLLAITCTNDLFLFVVQVCVSCCDEPYCNEPVPRNNATAVLRNTRNSESASHSSSLATLALCLLLVAALWTDGAPLTWPPPWAPRRRPPPPKKWLLRCLPWTDHRLWRWWWFRRCNLCEWDRVRVDRVLPKISPQLLLLIMLFTRLIERWILTLTHYCCWSPRNV